MTDGNQTSHHSRPALSQKCYFATYNIWAYFRLSCFSCQIRHDARWPCFFRKDGAMLTLHYRKLILRTNILPLHSRILPNWASQRWNHEVINCFHLQGLSNSKRAMLEDRDRKVNRKVLFHEGLRSRFLTLRKHLLLSRACARSQCLCKRTH